MADGRIEIDTDINTKGVDKGLKETFNKLKGFISKTKAANAGFISVIAAETKALQALIQGIRDTTEVYKVQQKAEMSLEQAARNNPYFTKQSVQNLKDFASELQNVTNIGDEQTIQLEAQLVATGRTEQEIIKIMRAAADYAAATGQDIQSAVQTLNSTYSGMAGQLGKQISEIKGLTKEELERGEAVDLIAEKYKGMAAAIVDAKTQAENAKGDLMEAWGQLTKPAADTWDKWWKGFYESGIEVVNKINSAMDYARKNWVIGGDYRGAKEYVKNIKEALNEIDASQKDLFLMKSVKNLNEEDLEAVEHYINLQRNQTDEERQLLQLIRAKKQDLSNLAEQQQKLAEIDAAVNAKSKSELQARKTQLEELLRSSGSLAESLSMELVSVTQKLTRMNNEEASAIAAVKKGYIDSVEKAKLEIEAKKESGEITTSIEEKQALLNAMQAAYIKLIKDSKGALDETDSDVQEIIRDISQLNTEVKTLVKNEDKEKKAKAAKDTYKNTIKAAEDEIRRKRELGKTITDLEEKQTMYNTKVSAWLKMMEDGGGAITDANTEAVQWKNEIIEEGKVIDELTKSSDRAKKFKEALKAISTTKSSDEMKKELDLQINTLQHLANGFWTTEEAERMSYKERVSLVEEFNTKLKYLAEQRKKMDKEEAAQKLETWKNTLQGISDYVDKFSQTTNNIANLAKETAKNEAISKTAEVEEQYNQGLISLEEYNKKKADIEKESAQKEYRAQMWQWTASIAQATAQIAQAALQALADTTTTSTVVKVANMAMMAALAGSQVAQIVASKPIPPSFATGGIVPGNSYYGDNVKANVNSGEMILNAQQQMQLWKQANGNGQRNNGGMLVQVNNSAANIVDAEPEMTERGMTIAIRKVVGKDMAEGRYNDPFRQMQSGLYGRRLTN